MKATHQDTQKERDEKEAERVKERGDVIGLSDADPRKKLPGNIRQDGGHPAGIEVGERATGIGDISQGPGATGIDMGAGGEGTQVSTDTGRTRRRQEQDPTD